jgi:hypothetical protein
MRTNTLVVLIAVALWGGSSIAIARGGGAAGAMAGGMSGGHFGHFGHFGRFNHFNHHFVKNRFFRKRIFLGGWGWGWGWPYSDNGYGNTTVVFPQAIPEAAGTTASIATPCHWSEDTFTVPASAGGTRPIQVVTCR